MAPKDESDAFVEYRRYLLLELERHAREIEEIQKKQSETKIQLAVMRTQAATISAVVGIAISVALKLIP